MCGLFGFVGLAPDVGKLIQIAEATANARGRDAWGVAWVDWRGRLRHHKAAGQLDRRALADAADAVALIGHCRLATHGDPRANENNHPHACDGGWLVHNGMLRQHWSTAIEHGLRLTTECDSELLARLIEVAEADDRCEQVSWAIETALGDSGMPCAVMALWRDQLVIARAGNPLARSKQREGTYIASLAEYLPGCGESYPDWEVDTIPVPQPTAKNGRSRSRAAS